MDHKRNIGELKEIAQKFCEDRDWDQFHGAKELAIGISTEAAELLQHFRFKAEEEIEELFKNKEKREQITDEIADVFFFLLRFVQKYDIDLTDVWDRKMDKNDKKYPIHKSKGSNKKYTDL